MYLTPEHLMYQVGLSELALRVGGLLNKQLDNTRLETVLLSTDIGSLEQDTFANELAARRTIIAKIADCSIVIDGYLQRRYTQHMPLSEHVVETSMLPGICGKLVRYELSRSPGEIDRADQQDALRQCRELAAGQMVLSLDMELTSAASSVAAKTAAAPRRSLTDGFGR